MGTLTTGTHEIPFGSSRNVVCYANGGVIELTLPDVVPVGHYQLRLRSTGDFTLSSTIPVRWANETPYVRSGAGTTDIITLFFANDGSWYGMFGLNFGVL